MRLRTDEAILAYVIVSRKDVDGAGMVEDELGHGWGTIRKPGDIDNDELKARMRIHLRFRIQIFQLAEPFLLKQLQCPLLCREIYERQQDLLGDAGGAFPLPAGALPLPQDS